MCSYRFLDCKIIIKYFYKRVGIEEVIDSEYIKNLLILNCKIIENVGVNLLNAVCVHKIRFTIYKESFIETLY